MNSGDSRRGDEVTRLTRERDALIAEHSTFTPDPALSVDENQRLKSEHVARWRTFYVDKYAPLIQEARDRSARAGNTYSEV